MTRKLRIMLGNAQAYYDELRQGNCCVHNDPLGTPQALTDESGTTVWAASYDPFGKATVNEDPDGDGNTVTLNVRMPGQYYDQETGLHYNYFRYYDPATGRYLRSDPVGILGGLNGYSYVRNNPLKWVDPLGLWPWYLDKPTEQQAQNAQDLLQKYVPNLSDKEAKQIINDSIDEASTGDFARGGLTFPSDMQLPKNLSDLNKNQQDFIKDFLDDLPDRNDNARDKIFKQCK